MKYIKTYEDLNDEPNLGDYVITTVIISDVDPKLKFFLENNVGKIIQDQGKGHQQYLVKYGSFYHGLGDYTIREWWFDKTEILYCSSDEEEVISILPYIHDVNKFNI